MSSAAADSDCIICLDSDPPPIQSGCACRGDGGLAHVGCLTEKAVSQQAYRGNEVWWKCQTCGQTFTGAVRFGLAAEWCTMARWRMQLDSVFFVFFGKHFYRSDQPETADGIPPVGTNGNWTSI
jgi:hypothetical protein